MKLLLYGKRLSVSVACACLLAVPVATAQYQQDFEALNASAAGVVLTGQDGYYIPAGTTSTDFLAYTYTGNALGLPQNPTGGKQFTAGTGPGGGTYARAQRDVDYGSSRVWTIGYDVLANYSGTAPAPNYLGSLSTQLFTGEATYNHLLSWVNVNTPVDFNFWYYAYNAAGGSMPLPGLSPGPAWDGLALDHWYRATETFDLDSNRIIEVTITDLTTGIKTVANPTDWYLEGGAAGGKPIPSGFRFFGGGGGAGNTTAWDNMSIIPEPSALALLVLGGLAILRRR